jgi:hypothetical protein
MDSGGRRGLVVVAGAGCGAEREPGAGGGVASWGVGPGVQDQDAGVVEGAAPGVAFALGVALGAAVGLAVAAQPSEGGGVAADAEGSGAKIGGTMTTRATASAGE